MSTQEFMRRALQLQRVFKVAVNIMECDDTFPAKEILKSHGIPVYVSPVENPLDLSEKGPIKFTCKAGINHIVITPDGSVYPCLTALRSPWHEDYKIGNIEQWNLPEMPCDLMCESYYILKNHPASADMWGVEVEPD